MNYIKQLQADRREYAGQVREIDEQISELVSYLLSPKFNNDTTVQVKDVLLRMEGLRCKTFDLRSQLGDKIQAEGMI